MNRIYTLANWKSILPLFLIFLGFMGYLFPSQQEKINHIANEELTSLDARMGYNKSDVVVLLERTKLIGFLS